MENKFLELLQLNVNDRVEEKNKLKYLSWSWAWSEFCKVYPNASYEIIKDGFKPYFADESGAMCYTKVTANGITHEMWLPVMDGSNNSMKNVPYTYQVKEYAWDNTKKKNLPTGKMIDKQVEAYTMFDINKTLMRCLVKNLAMFGLGLYLYSGEDLPEELPKSKEEIAKEQEQSLKEYNSKMDKAVEYMTKFVGNDMDKFEKVVAHMNKTFKSEHTGFNQFKLEELESYIEALNKKKG